MYSFINYGGSLFYGHVSNAAFIYPVISLKSDVLVRTSGNGSYTNPYVVVD